MLVVAEGYSVNVLSNRQACIINYDLHDILPNSPLYFPPPPPPLFLPEPCLFYHERAVVILLILRLEDWMLHANC